MKHSILVLTVLLSGLAHADLGEMHAKNCQAPEVKKLMGATGSCRVIVAPKKIEKQGSCTGTFMGSLPCIVTFAATAEGSAMNLTCGEDPKNPVINQDMEAEGMGYNVATLVKKADGQDVVLNDKNEYSFISNRMVDVYFIQNGVESAGSVSISLQTGPVQLTNVICR